MGILRWLQADRQQFGHQDEVVYVWQRLKLMQVFFSNTEDNAISMPLTCLLPKVGHIHFQLVQRTLYMLNKFEFYLKQHILC